VGYASVPPGWILRSDRRHPEYRYGTVDYPRRLTDRERRAYELEEVTR
jgi:hypothetical protein